MELDAGRITPLHDVNDEDKAKAITASMREHGWAGRPLLVVDDAGWGYVALTGTHRLNAAVATDTDVDAIVLDGDDLVAADVDIAALRTMRDDDREAELRDAGLNDAADMMADEISANRSQA